VKAAQKATVAMRHAPNETTTEKDAAEEHEWLLIKEAQERDWG